MILLALIKSGLQHIMSTALNFQANNVLEVIDSY